MLARWVFTVWGAWLGALGLAAALTASGIWNPNPILPVGLPVLMLAAGLGLVVAATVRLIRGPRRDTALAGLLVGTAPFWFLAGHILMAMRPAFDRHVPPGWPIQGPVAAGPAPRGPGSALVLPGADAGEMGDDGRGDGQGRPGPGGRDGPARGSLAGPARPVRDLADRLVSGAALRPAAGAPSTTWRSGPKSASRRRGADGLTDLDRHEVAHCVITRNYTARSDPPRVLMEGWRRPTRGRPPKNWPTPPGTTARRGGA